MGFIALGVILFLIGLIFGFEFSSYNIEKNFYWPMNENLRTIAESLHPLRVKVLKVKGAKKKTPTQSAITNGTAGTGDYLQKMADEIKVKPTATHTIVAQNNSYDLLSKARVKDAYENWSAP